MIEIESVTLHAPGHTKPILSSIDLTIGDGERVAILGPSGCGKSSLLKMLVGYFQPTQGSVYIQGDHFPSGGCPKSVGYLPQNSLEILMPWLSSVQSTRLIARLRAADTEHAPIAEADLFKRINLVERQQAFPLTLSGGERRRLGLAMVLSFCPKLLLLDEPFTGVDLDLRFDLWDLLSDYWELRKQKPAMLLVTHSLEEAAILCDYVVFLEMNRNGTRMHGVGKRRTEFSGDWNAKPSALYRDRDHLSKYLSYLDNEFTATIQRQ